MDSLIGDNFHLMFGKRDIDQHGRAPDSTLFRTNTEIIQCPRAAPIFTRRRQRHAHRPRAASKPGQNGRRRSNAASANSSS